MGSLGGVFKDVLIVFTPKFGEMIPFEEHLFRMGLKPPTVVLAIEISVKNTKHLTTIR